MRWWCEPLSWYPLHIWVSEDKSCIMPLSKVQTTWVVSPPSRNASGQLYRDPCAARVPSLSVDHKSKKKSAVAGTAQLGKAHTEGTEGLMN